MRSCSSSRQKDVSASDPVSGKVVGERRSTGETYTGGGLGGDCSDESVGGLEGSGC
jgi:hypothetical protein